MKNRILFFFKIYLFWVLYFIVFKILFLAFNLKSTLLLNAKELIGIFIHGFKLDLSLASYITMFTFFLMIILGFFRNSIFKIASYVLTTTCLIITSLIISVDLELYKYWGFRLDFTPLQYLNTPGEMVASVSYFVVIRQLFLSTIIFLIGFYIYKVKIEKQIKSFEKIKVFESLMYIIITGVLIIPVRGGLGLAPLNTGSAYFSQNQYANHAANNVVWNLAFSFTYYKESSKNPFGFKDEIKAREEIKEIYNQDSVLVKDLIKTEKPNIILIVVENFTSNIIGHVVDNKNITPNVSRYCKEGIYFSNFYASGNRTDKGLVALFSGFPAQPIASIIKFPYKTEQLPFITKDLKKVGYYSSFYYGGDVDFAAMRSYLKNAAFDELITDKDFPASTYGAKWGVHDEYVFDRLFQDIKNSKGPYMKAILTISNHEPFDVPMKPVFDIYTEEEKFFNTCYYTDSCIGIFIENIRKTKIWDSALIIITADHGARNPGNLDYFDDRCFEIPLIWLGGALKSVGIEVRKMGSQTDLANTLLTQLEIKIEKEYFYSKNLLADSCPSFAFYAFNSGFGFINDSCRMIYDNNSKALIKNEGYCTDSILNIGKSYQQIVYEDFLQKKSIKKKDREQK